MTLTSRSDTAFRVTYIPKGWSEPDEHWLPADEWPADHDIAVDAINARYEADYGEVLAIDLAGRTLYSNRRYL